MGILIGDWGLGIGDWAQSPIPNPPAPIPKPPNHNSSNQLKKILINKNTIKMICN